MGDDKKIRDKFTLVNNSVYSYVISKKIKLVDVVTYSAIKTQNDSGYGNSLSDIKRIFNIPYSSIKDSAHRLESCGLIKISYNNGKAICKEKVFTKDGSDRIPKTILMSKDLDLRDKSFLLAIWTYVGGDGSLDYTRQSLQNYVFKELHMGLKWVSSRIQSLSSFGLIYMSGRSIQINIDKIINISNNVVEDTLKDSYRLEDIVVEYEVKTGISRKNIFDWHEANDIDESKKVSSPKWLESTIDSINTGCRHLSKKEFEFESSELVNIGDNINKIVDEGNNGSKENVLKLISESIIWKSEMAKNGSEDIKYWTKGYFSRKKNNLSVNLYFYLEYLKKYPFAKKAVFDKSEVKEVDLVKKSVKKKTSEKRIENFKLFDYGDVNI